jgi:hypothetical protein
MDLESSIQQEFAAKKAQLREIFESELKEQRRVLNEEMAQKMAALTANLTSTGAGADVSVTCPPPPAKEVIFVLSDDLSNLPGRRAPLPKALTFQGHTTSDKERIKVLLGYARLLRKVPGAIFTDPLEDLREVLLRLRGDSRPANPASRVACLKSGMREPPRSRLQSHASWSRGHCPPKRSRSPLRRSNEASVVDSVVDRVRRLEHRVDDSLGKMSTDIEELKKALKKANAGLQRLEALVKSRASHRDSLPRRTAPPLPWGPGFVGSSTSSGEKPIFNWLGLREVFARGQDVVS